MLFARKILFAKGALQLAQPQIRNAATQLVSGPPSVRTTFVERGVHYLIIFCSMTAIPTWVLWHLPEYNGEEK